MDNINLNGGYSKEDMEMEIIPNDSEDLPGQKKSSFRSWKRFLWSYSNHTSANDSSCLQHLVKRTSSEYFSLKSQVHKKHILSTDSLSVSQSFVGGTFPTRPPPS